RSLYCSLKGRGASLFQDDGPLQSSITGLGDSLVDLHEHLCPLDHARDHGSQPERGVRYLLEMCTHRRAPQPLCQHMLFYDGGFDLCRELNMFLVTFT
ncbi:S-adenosylmethionine-dependent methyltransferase, partial [Penicillium frequentans]